MKLYGDWKRVQNLFKRESLKKAKSKAMKKTLAYFEGQIKRNIVSSGSLADKPFEPNAEYTIFKKGSSKPLIDKADMLGAVKEEYVSEDEGFVGLKRGKRHISGEDVADIGWINENGVITEWGQVIPERPFVYPVLEKFAQDATDLYDETFMKEMEKC